VLSALADSCVPELTQEVYWALVQLSKLNSDNFLEATNTKNVFANLLVK